MRQQPADSITCVVSVRLAETGRFSISLRPGEKPKYDDDQHHDTADRDPGVAFWSSPTDRSQSMTGPDAEQDHGQSEMPSEQTPMLRPLVPEGLIVELGVAAQSTRFATANDTQKPSCAVRLVALEAVLGTKDEQEQAQDEKGGQPHATCDQPHVVLWAEERERRRIPAI